MVELAEYMKVAIAEIKTLLFTRALTKKIDKANDKVIAEAWNVTPRRVRQKLSEANEHFKTLLPYFLMQPEISSHFTNEKQNGDGNQAVNVNWGQELRNILGDNLESYTVVNGKVVLVGTRHTLETAQKKQLNSRLGGFEPREVYVCTIPADLVDETQAEMRRYLELTEEGRK